MNLKTAAKIIFFIYPTLRCIGGLLSKLLIFESNSCDFTNESLLLIIYKNKKGGYLLSHISL